jgi:eukaryotic-like serine/threonine-protein kinase
VAKFGERYELIRRVGAGGMAEVWLAHDEELASRPVAIKIMHKHLLPNEDDVARFEREMRFAALMDHPNIVTVYTTGTCDGAPFLVMEYLRGHDLEKAPPGDDAELIAGIGRDICSGLAYAHREGVIHRDIKPANLFRCESGQVKITDFGVARAVGETALSTAVLVGTFAYMPPERWRGEPSAVSGDIWAAGCVLYRLISGRTPRLLPDVGHYAAAATRGDPVPDLRDITAAPDWLAGPVMAMLADDPAGRPTAGECVQALSSTRFSTPSPELPIGNWRITGQRGPDELVAGPVGGAASEDPVTSPVARQAAAHTTAGGSGRLNRAPAVVSGVALLLLAGSIAAWRLSTSPQAPGLAAGGATSPASSHSHAAAAAPAASASAPRPGSSATSPPGLASSAPAAARSGGGAGSSSTSPTGSRSAAPAGSPSSSPAGSPFPSPAGSPSSSPAGSPSSSPASTPTASPSDSAPASSTPPLVPVPDVIGMNFAQAKRLLQSDGFTVAGTHNPPGDKVVSTSPSGEAPEGSLITVVYGT